MPNLNIDLDFLEHRKTKRLVGLLGRGAEVLPIRLWSYCGKFHCEDGRLAGYSEQEIETLAGWWGKPGEMLQAMLRVGFLDRQGDGTLEIHDWLEHQGHIAAYKQRGKLMAKARWGTNDAKSNAASNAASIRASNAIDPPKQCQSRADRVEQIEQSQPSPPPPVQLAEFPVGFPPDEESAVTACAIACPEVPADEIRRFWNDAASALGTDMHDRPIRNWPHHVKARWSHPTRVQGASKARNGVQTADAPSKRNGVPVWVKRKRLEEERAEILRSTPTSAAGRHFRPGDRERMNEIGTLLATLDEGEKDEHD